MTSYTELLEGLAQAVGAGEVAHEPPEIDRFVLEGVGEKLSATPVSQRAIDLLIAAEVSSPAAYTARLTHPIWPGGSSGVTIGIGADIGTMSPAGVAADWLSELGQATIDRLITVCGVLGAAAGPLAIRLAAITIPFDQANRVFLRRGVPLFVGRTEHALPNTGLLGPDCLGALVSLTYNRGAAFSRPEDRFAEMRAIRDHMADRRFELIPGELRAMKRIWAGDPALRGVVLRREAEAQLFEQGLQVPVSTLKVQSEAPAAFTERGSGLFSTVAGWLRPVVEERTRDRIMVQLPGDLQGDEALVRIDEDYVAIRVLSARIVNERRWTSLYNGAIHATCSMLYEGFGASRSERQSVLAPEDFRDIDPKGQGKLLQVDRLLFGPMPYRGDLKLSLALFSVRSSDLAGPYLGLLSELSQFASLGFLAAAQPFVQPLTRAASLLFGTSDAASLECGTVRGFEPLRAGTWACLGASDEDIPERAGLHLEPETFRLLASDGHAVQDFPYMVFQVAKMRERPNWMEVPTLKDGWDAITASLQAGKPDDAKLAARTFRTLCFASGDLTLIDAARLADKADHKLGLMTTAGLSLEGMGVSLRSLDLYGEPVVDLDQDQHTDPDDPIPHGLRLESVPANRPWRVAASLLTLRDQLNARAPKRNKLSDGTIGDAGHQTRDSDHNAWIVDGGMGVVTAMDVTNDPAGGCDANALAEALRDAREPRIKYVIWNRRIYSATVQPWQWRPYTGSSPHDKHVHISVREEKVRYDSTSVWLI